MDKSLSPDRRADLVIEQMTLDEKINLVHGLDVWSGNPPPPCLPPQPGNHGGLKRLAAQGAGA
ncbi:MAG: hypothetical protein ACLQVX_13710 [Limisphaerales bacterium]